MDFRELKKFLNSLKKEYDIPGFDCCIYYDHNYVFRHKAGVSSDATRKKVSGKDLYFLHSACKVENVFFNRCGQRGHNSGGDDWTLQGGEGL